MEYSPPPLFKQGASARAKVVIFSMLAIALLVGDSRLQTLSAIRQVAGTVLYPLQRLALMPRDAVYGIGDYFSSLSSIETENDRLKRQQLLNAQALQQAQLLLAENAQLRKLLGASEQLPVKSLMAQLLYDARDAFTRKIVLDRGTRHGVTLGQPVIDDAGVVGQVTRVFPFTSETTLLTDKDQAIPVQVVRSGLRSVAYGRGQSGVLDLRFMPANADIQKGDLLVTSGIDGVYPAGLAVARVVKVEHNSADAFAKIVCEPAAGIDRNRQLLILLTELQQPRRPAEEAGGKKPVQNSEPAKETAKEPATELKQPAAQGAPSAKPAPQAAPAALTPVQPPAKPATKPAVTVPIKPVVNAPASPTRIAPVQPVPSQPSVPTTMPSVARPTGPAGRTSPQPVNPAPGSAASAPGASTIQNTPAQSAPAKPAVVKPASAPQAGAAATPAASRPAPVTQPLPMGVYL